MQVVSEREIAMFHRATLCGIVFSLASAGASGQQAASDGPKASVPDLLVAVDADGLAKAVIPQSIAAATQPRFVFPGVERSYQRQDTKESFELIVGIYPTVEDAGRALMRTMPQFARIIPERPGDDGFFSARGTHVRVQNVVVLLILAEPFSDEAQRVAIGLALEAALHDDSIVSHGDAVNTPQAEILGIDISKSPHKTRIRPLGDGEWVLPHGTRNSKSGQYRVDIRKGFYDDEPYLRLARPTGEVFELPLSEIPEALRLPPKTRVRRLSEQERGEIINKIRSGKPDVVELASLTMKLSQDADDALVPVFVEIMDSEHPASVKKHALSGIAEAEGKSALAQYRAYSADAGQHELIRRDAIRLIGRFGDRQDMRLLMEIVQEGSGVLVPAATDAIRHLERHD